MAAAVHGAVTAAAAHTRLNIVVYQMVPREFGFHLSGKCPDGDTGG
jgi:hypothetical protein